MGLGIQRFFNRHQQAIIDDLSLYAPGSGGDTRLLSRLTILSAQQVFPLLTDIMAAGGHEPMQPVSSRDFGKGAEAEADALAELLNRHGSDKAGHLYHPVYAKILQNRRATKLVEVGLGTTHDDIPSHMPKDGKPGASLRAFRDFLPKARVVGADIDRRILFFEDRIETCWVDQTDISSFAELRSISANFDLLIDDGLHSPNANLAVLLFGLQNMKKGAWTVIEDIVPAALPVWQIVAALLPQSLPCTILQARTSMMFAVERK